MRHKTILFAAALAALAAPAALAANRAGVGGQSVPVSGFTPLTPQECRDLGGDVETVKKKLCPTGKQCRSTVRNPQSGGVDVHIVCIDEVN